MIKSIYYEYDPYLLLRKILSKPYQVTPADGLQPPLTSGVRRRMNEL